MRCLLYVRLFKNHVILSFLRITLRQYKILIVFLHTQVVDFNVHVNESGEEYDEKIKVDTYKQTELFQVPAHPGVDRSDVLHDFKQVNCFCANIVILARLPKTDYYKKKFLTLPQTAKLETENS